MKRVFLLGLILFFSSCAKQITQSENNLMKNLRVGMPAFKVSKSLSFSKPKVTKEGDYEYWTIGNSGMIQFHDGKVLNWIDYSGPAYKAKISSFDLKKPVGKLVYVDLAENKNQEKYFIFQEVKPHIEKALKERGYRITKNAKKSDQFILVDFFKSAPNVDYRVESDPVYSFSYTPEKTHTITGQHHTNVYSGYGGQYLGYANTNSTYQYTSEAKFETQYMGQKTRTKKTVTYQLGLSLYGVDTKSLIKQKKVNQLWYSKLLVTNSPDDDVRGKLPFLVYSIKDYLNKNSNVTPNLYLNSTGYLSFTDESKLPRYEETKEDYAYGCKKNQKGYCLKAAMAYLNANKTKSRLYADIGCREHSDKKACSLMSKIDGHWKKREKKQAHLSKKCDKGSDKACITLAKMYLQEGDTFQSTFALNEIIKRKPAMYNVFMKDPVLKEAADSGIIRQTIKRVERQKAREIASEKN